MFHRTLAYLKCPACSAALECEKSDRDIISGAVNCVGCKKNYPILSGVLILVPDVRAYLVEHVKGISRQVSDQEIPKEHRAAFVKAKREIESEHIEEDLESERVTSLYVMNSYLRADQVPSPSPSIEALIKKHWDHGPFTRIRERLEKLKGHYDLIELGCGIGGLFHAVRVQVKNYLGLDSSFASIALARHFTLNAPFKGNFRVPHDLLQGPVSREVKIPAAKLDKDLAADFIVCELDHPPVKAKMWNATAALNVVDMLHSPEELPRLQYELLAPKGLAIQSSPYVWHEGVANELRSSLPQNIKDSASAVEWLYTQSGFKLDGVDFDIPWVFFKNIRQVELYSVHLFFAVKT